MKTATTISAIPSKRGFTLVEVMVVIAILGLLMMVLVPFLKGSAQTMEEKNTDASLNVVWTGIQNFIDKYGSPPDPSGNVANIKIEDPDNAGTQCTLSVYDDPESRLYMALTTDRISQTVSKAFMSAQNVREYTVLHEDSSGRKCYIFVDGYHLPLHLEVNNYGGTDYLCLRSYGPNGVKDAGDPESSSYDGDDRELKRVGTMTTSNQ